MGKIVITDEKDLYTAQGDLVTEKYELNMVGYKNPNDFIRYDRSFMMLDRVMAGIQSNKQDKNDDGLLTESKNVIGAINELKEKPGGEKLPIGTIVPFASEIIPLGYLLCDGREIQKKDYPELFEMLPDKLGKRYLPDLRGQFLRGNSAGRELLSFQGEDFKTFEIKSALNPDRPYGIITVPKNYDWSSTLGIGGADGEWRSIKVKFEDTGEVRPKNISVNYMIKATNVEQSGDVTTPVSNELNVKIENNRKAIFNHETEVNEEFAKRDEVVTLWEGNNTSDRGTLTLNEDFKNFKQIYFEGLHQDKICPYMLMAVKSGVEYYLGSSGRDWFITFEDNGLNISFKQYYVGIKRITGIGRVKK